MVEVLHAADLLPLDANGAGERWGGLAPGGAGLALSSSPEVRPLPCPSVPTACLLASQPPLLGAEGRGAPRVRGLAVSTRV